MNVMAAIGTCCSVSPAVHDRPPSAEWNTWLPGDPAIHTCEPRTATAEKSNWRRTSGGISVGGACHVWPPSAVVITSPPSPTSQPTARPGELHLPHRSQTERRTVRRLDAAVARRSPFCRRKVQRRRGPTSIMLPATQSTASAVGSGDHCRPPSSVKKTPQGYKADACPIAQPRVERRELDSPQRREQELVDGRPMLAAIVRAQQHAGREMRVGRGPASRGPAVLGIDELHGPQSTSDARCLLQPMTSAVGRVPDHARIADRPAMLAVDERQIVDCRVVAIRSDRRVVGRRTNGKIGNRRRRPEVVQ